LDAPAFLIDCDQERGSSEHVNLLDQRRQLLKRFESPGKSDGAANARLSQPVTLIVCKPWGANTDHERTK
jgi:hypothetical protein